jgi:hypothetical protein
MVLCLRRPSDFLGRYGGEEFVAVLPTTNAVGARIVTERLRAAVEALAIPHASSPCARVATISAGFATWSGRGERSADELVAAADAALLRAKLAGRNRIVGEAPAAVRTARVSPYRWARFAPVIADPWFTDRIPGFLAAAKHELAQLGAAAERGALEGVPLAARRLKARAIEYGFDQLRRLGAELEMSVRVADREAVRDCAAEIVEYIEHVQVVYRRPTEAAATETGAQGS